MRLIVALLTVFWIAFSQDSFENSVQKAKTSDRLMLIYFKSQFCPYCAQVEDFVFSDEAVSKKISSFVFLELDIRSEEGSKLSRKFGVPGTPTLVIYDPKEDKVVSLLFGSRPKDDFVKTLNRACKLYNIKPC